jgi:hypothetical protein
MTARCLCRRLLRAWLLPLRLTVGAVRLRAEMDELKEAT